MSLKLLNNIVIIGSNGLIGSELFWYAKKFGLNVDGLSRELSETCNILFDLKTDNFDIFNKYDKKSTLIINCVSVAHSTVNVSDVINTNISLFNRVVEIKNIGFKVVELSSIDTIFYTPKLNKVNTFWARYILSKSIIEKIAKKNGIFVVRVFPFFNFSKFNVDLKKRIFYFSIFKRSLLFPKVNYEYCTVEHIWSSIINIGDSCICNSENSTVSQEDLINFYNIKYIRLPNIILYILIIIKAFKECEFNIVNFFSIIRYYKYKLF